MILSREGRVEEAGRVVYRLEKRARERWDLRIDIVPSPEGEHVMPRLAERRFEDEIARVRDSLAAWHLRVPQLRATWDDLAHSFGRSVSDAASLRMGGSDGMGSCPAAGMPVVHDRLRARHDHHLPPDAAFRARARRDGAGGHRGLQSTVTTRRGTPSPARSSTRSAAARRRGPGTARTTGRSTPRRCTWSALGGLALDGRRDLGTRIQGEAR